MNIFFIISIVCLAVCLLMFFYLRWYIKKRITASALEEREEVEQLIVDINSVTDRNLQLIEDSITKLKKILEDAEKQIQEYKDVIEIKPSRENLYTSLGRGIRSALIDPEGRQTPPLPMQSEHPLKARQLSLVQQNNELFETPVKPERKTTSQSAPAAQKPPASEKPPASDKPPKKQIRAAIDSLANEGLSPEEIASRLEISIAQVNLAMNLRRSKR